jgi:1-deoxy-D-xylulose-5-phosphate synthase
MVDWKKPFEEVTIGKGRKLKDGKEIAIISFGHPGNFAQTAIRQLRTDGIDPAHYDLRFVKPLDEALLHEVFQNYDKIVTVEDGTIVGGVGAAILEFMNEHGYHSQIKILGIPDSIVEHGSLKELQHECHYDANAIADAVKTLLGQMVLTEA